MDRVKEDKVGDSLYTSLNWKLVAVDYVIYV